jgi:predicted nucleotidyltransferase
MLHWNTVTPSLKNLILYVSANEKFKSFRLGGGTALALQLGHRISEDADYIADYSFDKEKLSHTIQQEINGASDLYIGEIGVFLKANGIKLDFLSWNIPFIKPVVNEDGLQLLHVEEIAAMKLFAITQRGEKKDYFDIAVLLQHYSLQQLLEFYLSRNPLNDTSVILRFLVSFSDIELQPEPLKLIDMEWKEAKSILKTAVKEYLQKQNRE